LRLPAELRLEIYRLILTGKTIHINGRTQIDSQGHWGYKMFYKTCTQKPERMESLSHLNGASHSQDQSSPTSHGTQKPCLGIYTSGGSQCNDPVRIDVQLLRVCRQISDEAGLLPYAENYLIVPSGFHKKFREAFIAQFCPEKRSAMHTVAVLKNWERDVELIPTVLPGLKRLWFDVNKAPSHKASTLASRQSKVVETFSQIKLPSLIGVTVNYRCTWIPGEDEKSIEERLELALLGNQSS